MGRRKKTETVVENPTPMEEGAVNQPEESSAEEKTEDSLPKVSDDVQNSLEKVSNDVQNSLEKVEDNIADVILGAENVPVVEEKKEEKKAPVPKVVVTTASKVNVRKVPNGDVLFMINNGSQVMVEEEKDGWSKVTGYIMTELLK